MRTCQTFPSNVPNLSPYDSPLNGFISCLPMINLTFLGALPEAVTFPFVVVSISSPRVASWTARGTWLFTQRILAIRSPDFMIELALTGGALFFPRLPLLIARRLRARHRALGRRSFPPLRQKRRPIISSHSRPLLFRRMALRPGGRSMRQICR